MKNCNPLPISLFITMVIVVTAAESSSELSYESIVDYSTGGPLTTSILEDIQSVAQLIAYCTETKYDTSLLTALPDFDTKTVIGLVTKYGGGNIIRKRTLQRIVDHIDTIVVEVIPDSQVFDTGMSIQAGYSIVLLTIPKTDKPVVLRESPVTSISKSLFHAPEFQLIQQTYSIRYDLRGRLLPMNRSGIILGYNRSSGRVKRMVRLY